MLDLESTTESASVTFKPLGWFDLHTSSTSNLQAVGHFTHLSSHYFTPPPTAAPPWPLYATVRMKQGAAQEANIVHTFLRTAALATGEQMCGEDGSPCRLAVRRQAGGGGRRATAVFSSSISSQAHALTQDCDKLYISLHTYISYLR